MQLLGELDAADGRERMLRGEQQHAPLARAVIDEGEPRQVVVERGDGPLEQAARRRPVVVAMRAIVAANGEVGERHWIFGRLEEQRLDRRVEHALMQLEQIFAVVALQPVGARVLLELGAGALDLGQHALAADLDGARESDFARRHGGRGRALGLAGGLVGELGDALGDLRSGARAQSSCARSARGRDELRATPSCRNDGARPTLSIIPASCAKIGQLAAQTQALFVALAVKARRSWGRAEMCYPLDSRGMFPRGQHSPKRRGTA